jgi:hypothetical protein
VGRWSRVWVGDLFVVELIVLLSIIVLIVRVNDTAGNGIFDSGVRNSSKMGEFEFNTILSLLRGYDNFLLSLFGIVSLLLS